MSNKYLEQLEDFSLQNQIKIRLNQGTGMEVKTLRVLVGSTIKMLSAEKQALRQWGGGRDHPSSIVVPF